MLVNGVASTPGWSFEASSGTSSLAKRVLQVIEPAVVILTSLALSIAWIVSASGRVALHPLRVWASASRSSASA